MDIYSFINSNAIREYLREIKYEFSTIETAWLIYQCRLVSFEEKCKAWNTLIEEKPDCAMEKRMNCLPRESLHRFIEDYINIMKKQFVLFNANQSDAVYQYRYFCTGDRDWEEDYEDLYSSLEACWTEIDKWQKYGIEIVQIRKKYIDSNNSIIVTYKPDRTVMDIESNILTDDEADVICLGFDGLWFDFPVPFKKGDILIGERYLCPYYENGLSGPFVMKGITPLDTEAKERRNKGFGDTSDMNAWGYFQDVDGRIFHEVMGNYMDLEYYQGPYEGIRRLLVALSNYIKGEIEIDLLLTAYRKVIMDEATEDVMFSSWYTKLGLSLAGLIEN